MEPASEPVSEDELDEEDEEDELDEEEEEDLEQGQARLSFLARLDFLPDLLPLDLRFFTVGAKGSVERASTASSEERVCKSCRERRG